MIRFVVPGTPAPGGSKRAFVNKHTGRVAIVDDAKNNAGWKGRVAVFARQAMAGRPVMRGAVRLEVTFWMPRPKDHYGTGRNAGKLKPWAVLVYPTGPPDTTKLLRSTEDAMKGIVWRDDSQVIIQVAVKDYGEEPGAEVIAVEIDKQARPEPG